MCMSERRASSNQTEGSLQREIHRIQAAARRTKRNQDKDKTFTPQAGLADIDELDQKMLPDTLELSSMTTTCYFCGALGFQSEANITSDGRYHFGSMCCKKGEIKIRPPPPVPTPIQELFDPKNDTAKFFLPNIRKFNSGMSMASFQFSDMTMPGAAMIRIQGQVQRHIGSLISRRQSQARNIQTYFLDEHLQAQHCAEKAGMVSDYEKEMGKKYLPHYIKL